MSKPIVNLVSEWSAYEESHPGADLNSFYRYMLSKPAGKSARPRSENVGQLARVVGRLASAYGLYHRSAMEAMRLPSSDSFFYLMSLYHLGETRKTELINYLFAETTTGMEGINKLVKAGLAKERPDPDDGRAKLVSLTDKGVRKLKECMPNAQKVNEMVFKDLTDDTLSVCIQLLQSVEAIHSRKSIELKQKSFSEMYRETMAE